MSQVNAGASANYTFYKRWTNGWATTREATNATSNADTGAGPRGRNARRDNGSDFEIDRSVIVFNTQSIPANATVSAVTLKWFRRTERNEQNSTPGIYFCPVSATGVDSGYYNQAYFGTEVGYLQNTYSYPSGGGDPQVWADVTLTPSCIVKAGNTLLGVRMGHDYLGSVDFPGNTSKENYMETENTGNAHPPYLVVTYTTPPAVTTGAASNIENNSATLAGNVTDAGGGTVSERGICWSTSANPTTSNSKATAAGSTGAYSVSAGSLNPNTLYHFRAYVITENSTQYGADQTFTTDTTPTVTTSSPTNVGAITATGNGNVTDDGRGVVSERGFCINKTGNPTTADTKFTAGSGTGAFTAAITGLLPGTKYYIRSYAINGVGTTYGANIMFMTQGGAILFNFL